MSASTTHWEDRDPLHTNEQIDLLESNARHLVGAKQYDDAERIYREILRLNPDHLGAIHFFVNRHLARGELDEAQSHIERGAQLDFGNPLWHQHLGVILRSRNYLHGALRAFAQALQLNPMLAVTWVQLGDVLQALERKTDAIKAYYHAELLIGNLSQPKVNVPPKTSRVLMQAAKVLYRERIGILDKTLAEMRERHDDALLKRVENAVLNSLEPTPPYRENIARSRERFHLEGLGARTFYSLSDFDCTRGMQKHCKAISMEARDLLAAAAPTPASSRGHFSADASTNWESLGDTEQAGAFYLHQSGVLQSAAARACPATTELVKTLPLMHFSDIAPQARFLALEPGAKLSPRCELSNFALSVALPLSAPAGSTITLAEETRGLKAGKPLVFDPGFIHNFRNEGEAICTLLIFELWHPEVNEPEREFLCAAQDALGSFGKTHHFGTQSARRDFLSTLVK